MQSSKGVSQLLWSEKKPNYLFTSCYQLDNNIYVFDRFNPNLPKYIYYGAFVQQDDPKKRILMDLNEKKNLLVHSTNSGCLVLRSLKNRYKIKQHCAKNPVIFDSHNNMYFSLDINKDLSSKTERSSSISVS